MESSQQSHDPYFGIKMHMRMIQTSLFFGRPMTQAWLFRDDIGAPHGIKGYEEQVNSVGMHHGICHWPSEITWNTFNSATLRRGFKVF